MNIIFVISNFYIGGSEIYIRNISSILVKHGFNVSILILGNYDKNLIQSLEPKINFLQVDAFLSKPFIYLYRFIHTLYNPLFILFLPFISPKKQYIYDHVHAMDSESLIFSSKLKLSKKITTGIYHHKEFIWESTLNYKTKINKFLSNFPISNVYSDKLQLLISHSKIFKNNNLTNSQVFNFGIINNKKNLFNPNSKLIIVASRFTKFKLFIPYIIRLFNSKYFLNEYTLAIVGDGEMKREWSKIVDSPRILLIGELSPEQLVEYISKGIVFLGSGSTTIIAAGLSIPTIVLSDSDPNGHSKGFFHELDFLTFKPDLTDGKIENYLEKFINLTDYEKLEISYLTLDSSTKYSIEEHTFNFLNFINNSADIDYISKISYPNIIDIIILYLFDFLRINRSFRFRFL